MNNKWLTAAALSVILIVLFFLYQKYRVAPSISFAQLQLVDLADKKADAIVRGNPRIITFGASWCSSCISELNALKDLSGSALNNVEVIVISDEPQDVIERFRAAKQYPFTFLRMTKKFGQVGINTLPTTYFVNGNGEIKKETVGLIRWDDNYTVNHLLHLLQ